MKSAQRKRGNTDGAGLQPVPVPMQPTSPRQPFEKVLRQCSSQNTKARRQIWLVRALSWLSRVRAIAPLASAWAWLKDNYASSTTKRMRVAETVSLGEKRFVAILRVDGREFLIGGGTSGISLLTQIEKPSVKKTSPRSRAKATVSVMREVCQ